MDRHIYITSSDERFAPVVAPYCPASMAEIFTPAEIAALDAGEGVFRTTATGALWYCDALLACAAKFAEE